MRKFRENHPVRRALSVYISEQSPSAWNLFKMICTEYFVDAEEILKQYS
jgi:hypothetical protein